MGLGRCFVFPPDGSRKVLLTVGWVKKSIADYWMELGRWFLLLTGFTILNFKIASTNRRNRIASACIFNVVLNSNKLVIAMIAVTSERR